MFPDRKQRVLQPATPIDHPFVEIARFESGASGAEFIESDERSGPRMLREAFRRKVPRVADRDAHPARKAWTSTPRRAATAAILRWLVKPFF
jgi:hypothetical protein